MFRLVFSLLLAWPAFAVQEVIPPLWSTWTKGEAGEAAIRLRAFEDNANIEFDLQPGNNELTFRLEGPLAAHGDSTAIGAGPALPSPGSWVGAKQTLALDLPKAGIYRLILKPKNANGYVFRLREGPGAVRPSMTLPEFLTKLRDTDGSAFQKTIEVFLTKLRQDPMAAAKYASLLSLAMQRSDFSGLERFPTLPSPVEVQRQIKKARASFPKTPVFFSDPIYKGENLAALVQAAPAGRDGVPPEASAKLPEELTWGHYPDLTLPKKFAAGSPVVAQVFTSLASKNGSRVTLPGPRGAVVVRSPREAIDALIKTGHRVKVYEEKTLANFTALNWKGTPVYWPVWEDTGLKLASGEKLVVPSSHSQVTWEISGPHVNGRVAAFLGLDGVGFWPASDERPTWTGFERQELGDSGVPSDRPKILKSVELATAYHQMIREEQRTIAAGLPGGGYFYLGVCNNISFLNQVFGKAVNTWPLTRPRDLKPPPGTDSELATLLERAPSDGGGLASGQTEADYRLEALRRIEDSVPANAGIRSREPDFATLLIHLSEELRRN